MADTQPFVQYWKEAFSSSYLQSTGLGADREQVLLGEQEFIKRCHAAKDKESFCARCHRELM